MTTAPFVSYAQNAEDVVLYRALGSLPTGRYLEIGAYHPTEDSISRPFYNRNWSGITVEPIANLVEAHRIERPRDTQVQAVAGRPGTDHAILHEVAETGLSTTIDGLRDAHVKAGFTVADIDVCSLTANQILEQSQRGELHFAVIDAEGSEADVLAGFDLRRWRPWVLVVEATVPNSNEPSHAEWEPGVLESGYDLCLFDGISRFYVAAEHAEDLKKLLSFPANALDKYVHHRDLETRELANSLTDEVVRWRSAALTRWSEAVSKGSKIDEDRATIASLRRELASTHRTISWRVTSPLRNFRKLYPR